MRVLELQAISDERRGRLGDALATYRRLLQVQPEHATARYNAAILLWALGELPAAAAELRTLLRFDPGDHPARYRLGALLAQTGPPEEAARVLGEYLEAEPDDADALATLAQVERQRGRYEAALEAYGAAAELLPAGDRRQAELAFERAWILLAALEDPGAGLAALTLALENGYRDLDRLNGAVAGGAAGTSRGGPGPGHRVLPGAGSRPRRRSVEPPPEPIPERQPAAARPSGG